MIDDTTILGATFGQFGQVVKQAAKQVVKLPEEMGQDVGGQVGGVKEAGEKSAENKPQQPWQSDEERVKFLRNLYGKSDVPQDGKKPTEFEEQIEDKTPEEQKKLLELRQQLHKENYYDPTFNPVKNPPASGERPAEKVENEKKQEMQDLQQKKAENPPPLAVIREQNKAEMFRGAAG